MNQSYYENIKSYFEQEEEQNQKLWSVTCLEGTHAGEKKLLNGNDIPEHFQTGVCKMGESMVFAEEIQRSPVCVICGAGHVGIPMIRIASFAVFEVIVVEDRPSFADQARKAGADRVICGSFEKGLEEIEGGQQTYFVVMTRGHRYDEVCLTTILKKSAHPSSGTSIFTRENRRDSYSDRLVYSCENAGRDCDFRDCSNDRGEK